MRIKEIVLSKNDINNIMVSLFGYISEKINISEEVYADMVDLIDIFSFLATEDEIVITVPEKDDQEYDLEFSCLDFLFTEITEDEPEMVENMTGNDFWEVEDDPENKTEDDLLDTGNDFWENESEQEFWEVEDEPEEEFWEVKDEPEEKFWKVDGFIW